MQLNPHKGLFVDIEGLDGSGSDKVAKLLATHLKRKGFKVLLTKEPTRGPIGRFTRKLIKTKGKLSPVLLEFLFAADRALQLEEKIVPALQKGYLVVGDRALWSSIAYRSVSLPIHWLLEVNRGFILPDAAYFVDVPVAKCASRIKKGEDDVQLYIKRGDLDLVREGFSWVHHKFPHCFFFVNGDQKQDKVLEEILERLEKQDKFKS